MSMLPLGAKNYSDGRTKQAFKNSTDINKLLAKAQKTGTISHLNKHEASYGDFTDMPTLLEAQTQLARGREIFDDLPSEIRKEFAQSPSEFFKFVNDPANKDDLARVLPALALPGRQHIRPGQGREEGEVEGEPSSVPEVVPEVPESP